ncbi:MAG TPA: GNAT family N-acetyltransferase, partial [Thermoguttaceae bacterium]|nr:GNAT family N-acetyltransferase [Thermoguttaceae bacterium]
MIRKCTNEEFATVHSIINDAAEAYRGVIPADRWTEPYMSVEYLRHELDAGVVFWGYEDDGQLIGVMGIQDVDDVTLIRHAYVRTVRRGQGIGGKLLESLHVRAVRPTLIGTWTAADWAVRFYANRGFRQVSVDTKNRLLRRYWSIPERQTETSVVLADQRWWKLNPA